MAVDLDVPDCTALAEDGFVRAELGVAAEY